MEELEKNIRINELFDIYGELLSKTQQKMITLYYRDDLSLGEISEEEGISRNAVYDSIKKGTTLLEEYESKIHVLEKEKKMYDFFNELKNENLSEKERNLLERIINKEAE